MKKNTNKPTKLSKFEKRVEERHKRQEAEYGRDEFLFGAAEDDEEADVEFDEDQTPSRDRDRYDYADTADTYANEADYADVDDGADYADTESDSVPHVGERTEMIAAEIVEAEMASLAAEMSSGAVSADAAETVARQKSVSTDEAEPVAWSGTSHNEPAEPERDTPSVGSETMNISAAILAETERALAESELTTPGAHRIDDEVTDAYRVVSEYEDEDEPEDEDEDFDFYNMSETAEIEAAAIAQEMYHRPEHARTAKPKVHKEQSAHRSKPSHSRYDETERPTGSAKAAKASAKDAKSAAKTAKSSAKSAKSTAKSAKSAARSAKSAKADMKAAAKYRKKADAYRADDRGSRSSSRSRKDRDRRRRGGFFGGIADFFSNMTMGDRLIVVTGVCVLATAIVTGVIFANTQTIRKQVASFDTVGASTDGIYIVGENGLNAVVAARAGYAAVQEEVDDFYEEEEQPEEIVIEESTITIVMKVSSVQSDLKIKFANKSTDKLISGIPFEVTVTSDSGKEYNWSDENKDGLMYHTEVPNGTYNVSMKPLEGPEYEDYVMPADVKGVKVTDTIQYKKVDVADEVKTEAEVNVAQEDTAVQDTAIESQLKDTVEWVESTKTLISGSEEGYTSIDKGSIPNPYTKGKLDQNSNRRAMVATSYSWMMPYMGTEPGSTSTDTTNENGSGGGENTGGENNNGGGESGSGEGGGGSTPVNVSISVSPSSLGLDVGQTGNVSATVTGNDDTSVSWSSSNESVATVSGGTVTAVSAGSAAIIATSNADSSKTASCSVTVNEPTPSVTVSKVELNQPNMNLTVGDSSSLTATVKMSDNSTNSSVSWSSSDSSVVSVSGGSLSAKKAGTATITATSTSDSSKSASCSITVVDKTVANISLSTTSVSIKVGATSKVAANVSGTSDTTVTWTSKDTSIATVESDGTIKGVKAGSTTVTATLKADTTKTATVSVTVTSSVDPNGKLLDSSGRQVYIKNSDGTYREAKISDYEGSEGFYIKGGSGDAVYKYTGWQTIDGSTYFYDKDGNYVTGDQVIQGAKYTFSSDGHLQAGSGTMGIDVSKWNGNIDWTAVRNSGVSYVIIRCGYRGSSTGALIEDPKFRSNIKGAKAAGLSVGAYFYTQAVNEVEAVEEASMAIGLCSGYGLNLPIFLDVEHSGGRGDSIDAGTRTAVCKAFCNTVRNSGFGAGIYANKVWLTSYMHASQLTGYKIWLAQYAATPTYTATRYDYWQYTSKGSVAGISGNVDMNIRY